MCNRLALLVLGSACAAEQTLHQQSCLLQRDSRLALQSARAGQLVEGEADVPSAATADVPPAAQEAGGAAGPRDSGAVSLTAVGAGGRRSNASTAGAAKSLKAVANASAHEAAAAASAQRVGVLRLELRLRLALNEIHAGPQGPLHRFLQSLRSELCAAAALPPERLSLLSVRGEYIRLDLLALRDAGAVEAALVAAEVKEGGVGASKLGKQLQDPALAHMHQDNMEDTHSDATTSRGGGGSPKLTIVDLEVLPGSHAADPTPDEVLSLWKDQLHERDSRLTTGSLSQLMKKADFVVAQEPEPSIFTPGHSSRAHASAVLGGGQHGGAGPRRSRSACALPLLLGLLQQRLATPSA